MKSMWLVGLLAVCYAFNVQAVNINISGTVVATPCVVDLTSVNQTIDFGQLRATDFQNVQSAGEWRPFSLLLTNCPASTTQVTTTLPVMQTALMPRVSAIVAQRRIRRYK